ncbi:MAG: serine hydrolase, partial [Verrucomicrobiota bacterium]
MSHSLKLSFTGLALSLTLLALTPSSSRAIDATAYMIMDSTTGHVLDAKNANKKVQVGSLTKIATAMVVLDWAELNKKDLNELATVPAGASVVAGMNPTGIQTGDRVSLRDLLYAALLQSDNAAAYTLADHVGQNLE